MMSLRERYELLPKATYPRTEFVDAIFAACIEAFGEGSVSRATILNWCSGATTPCDSKFIPVISAVTGIPENDLFKL